MAQGFAEAIGAVGFQGVAPFGPTLPNAFVVNGFVGNAGTGDVDLYTVPAGKRAVFLSLQVFNPSLVVTITTFAEVKIGGTYYQVGGSVNANPDSLGTPSSSSYVAEAGEILAVNLDTAGGNIWARIIVFDNTGALQSPKLVTLTNGDNTLYTVPTGKTANVVPSNFSGFASLSAFIYLNLSGGARVINLFAVSNGGASGASNKFLNAASVSDGQVTSRSGPAALNSGDFLVINTDGTGAQFVFTTLFEL